MEKEQVIDDLEDIESNNSFQNDFDEEDFWLPDDIVTSTRWTDGEIYYPKGLFDDFHGIKARKLYSPAEISSDTLILFIIIHGTWGQKSGPYFDDQDEKNQEFRSIKRSAAWYSTYNKKNLELLSYFWKGEWRDYCKRYEICL